MVIEKAASTMITVASCTGSEEASIVSRIKSAVAAIFGTVAIKVVVASDAPS